MRTRQGATTIASQCRATTPRSARGHWDVDDTLPANADKGAKHNAVDAKTNANFAPRRAIIGAAHGARVGDMRGHSHTRRGEARASLRQRHLQKSPSGARRI